MKMKALTLKHPWPWAILWLGKRVENRSWSPWSLRVGEWFALHGGREPSGAGYWEARRIARELAKKTGNTDGDIHPFVWTGIFALTQYGGLIDTDSQDVWYDGPDYCGWKLENLIVVKPAIQCPGAQGLWTVPPQIAARLGKVIAEHRRG
jgi:hypothetical protein